MSFGKWGNTRPPHAYIPPTPARPHPIYHAVGNGDTARSIRGVAEARRAPTTDRGRAPGGPPVLEIEDARAGRRAPDPSLGWLVALGAWGSVPSIYRERFSSGGRAWNSRAPFRYTAQHTGWRYP